MNLTYFEYAALTTHEPLATCTNLFFMVALTLFLILVKNAVKESLSLKCTPAVERTAHFVVINILAVVIPALQDVNTLTFGSILPIIILGNSIYLIWWWAEVNCLNEHPAKHGMTCTFGSKDIHDLLLKNRHLLPTDVQSKLASGASIQFEIVACENVEIQRQIVQPAKN